MVQFFGRLDQRRPIKGQTIPIGGGHDLPKLLLSRFPFTLLLQLETSEFVGGGAGAGARH